MAVRRAVGAVLAVSSLAAPACGAGAGVRTEISAAPGAMAVLVVTVSDRCSASEAPRAAAWSVWVDGRHSHDALLFPGVGPARYESLLGPFSGGRHSVELRTSDLWAPADCVSVLRLDAATYEDGTPEHAVYRHAPVLELRADTIGEQTDLPLYAYAERVPGEPESTWRYTIVLSDEDGGTPTRALLARWGRTTDIEQVYEVGTAAGRITREDFQGPDHVTRPFRGRREGEAPVLLVATMNNMVIDRGRSLASIRPVPAVVDLSRATRESTMDVRPWVYRVMARELAAEGKIAADAPDGDGWPRLAPDPLSHVFLEARLRLDRTVAVAWVTDRSGRRLWSHYGRMPLAIDRDGWVRSAVAVGPDPSASLAAVGWACLAAPDAKAGGTCQIEATRAFALAADYRPGANLITPGRVVLKAGGETKLERASPGPL